MALLEAQSLAEALTEPLPPPMQPGTILPPPLQPGTVLPLPLLPRTSLPPPLQLALDPAATSAPAAQGVDEALASSSLTVAGPFLLPAPLVAATGLPAPLVAVTCLPAPLVATTGLPAPLVAAGPPADTSGAAVRVEVEVQAGLEGYIKVFIHVCSVPEQPGPGQASTFGSPQAQQGQGDPSGQQGPGTAVVKQVRGGMRQRKLLLGRAGHDLENLQDVSTA